MDALELTRNETFQRPKLPKEYFAVDSLDFVLRLFLFGAGVTLCAATIIHTSSLALMVLAQFVLGVLFAHAVELQHECLHGLGFRSKAANRWGGRLMGLPMVVAFTEYMARHLEHHKWLGTAKNTEFFSYDHNELRSWGALLRHAYSMRRFRDVFGKTVAAFKGEANASGRTTEEQAAIRNEYRVMGLLVLAALVASVVFQSWLVVSLWIVPLLISGEAAHFFIELPEHVGCDDKSRDVFENTRTIVGGGFSTWLTVGNNLHVEHHLYPKVPVCRRRQVHKLIAPRLKHVERSYFGFLAKCVKRSELTGKRYVIRQTIGGER